MLSGLGVSAGPLTEKFSLFLSFAIITAITFGANLTISAFTTTTLAL
jgi:predicted permease